MTKEQVIYMKNKLKASKGFAIIATLANGADIIDETEITGFVHWDDANGYAYQFELSDPISDSSYQRMDKHVNVKMVPYDEITSMKAIGIPVETEERNIDDMISSIGITGKEALYIKSLYKALVNHNMAGMTRGKLQEIIQADFANDEYSYYDGYYHQPFKETVETDRYNYENRESIKNAAKPEDELLDLANKDGYITKP